MHNGNLRSSSFDAYMSLMAPSNQGMTGEDSTVGSQYLPTTSASGRRWLMPDELLDLLEAAERVDHASRPATRGCALQIQGLIERTGCTLIQAATEMGLAISTASRLAQMQIPDREPSVRRAILAAAALSGLRAEELYALQWRDIEFLPARITVRTGRKRAVVRLVEISEYLRLELSRWKRDGPSRHHYRLVFPTARGIPRGKDNLRKRVLAPALREANRARLESGAPPLPDGIGPEWLRRTFVALQAASGQPLDLIQRQADVDTRTAVNIHAQVAQVDLTRATAPLDPLHTRADSDNITSRARPTHESLMALLRMSVAR
jgi:integrase